MFKVFKELYRLLPPPLQRKMNGMIALQIVAAFMETLGVFSVLPFLALAADPARIQGEGFVGDVFRWSGAADPNRFLLWVGIATVVLIIGNSIFGVANMFWTTKFGIVVYNGMLTRLSELLFSRRYRFFLTHNSAVLGNAIMGECFNLYSYAINPLISTISRAVALIAVGSALVVYNWKATLGIVLLLGLFYGGIYLRLRRAIHRYGEQRSNSNEERSLWFYSGVNGMKDIKIAGLERIFLGNFVRASETYGYANYRATAFQLAPRFLIDIVLFGGVVMVVLIAILLGKDLVTLIPALSVYAMAGYRLLPGLQQIYVGFSSLRFAGPVIDKLTGLLDELEASPSEDPNPVTQMEILRCFELRDLRFRYEPEGKPILNGVSLTVPFRSCVGVVGASGSGKSTLMDLAMGLLQPDDGAVVVDGVVLDEEGRRRWQISVGYVPQQIYLLDASIAENIAFGSTVAELDLEQVEAAARAACLHELIKDMPDGYRTRVGERGVRLSGGQRQRIGIARALYRKPEVLFFDEATSALDNETEEMVVDSIRHLSGKKTIVMIAHRLSTLRFCERVIMLEKGVVKKSGTFEEICGNG